jgi:xanthine/uracil/vitamin C permease (AzgA family)
VDELIDALTDAAHEAVEAAAGEAAKAAAIASVQSQAAALSEAAKWEREYKNLKSNSMKTAWTVGAVSFSVGAFVGVSAVVFFMRR